MKVNKFALCAFNFLAYNYEISGPLAVNTLLHPSKYYTPEKSLKRVNLENPQLYFFKIIFQGTINKETTDSFIPFGILIIMPISNFNDYNYRGKQLELYSVYNYIKTISHIKYSARQNDNILFDKSHPNPLSKI